MEPHPSSAVPPKYEWGPPTWYVLRQVAQRGPGCDSAVPEASHLSAGALRHFFEHIVPDMLLPCPEECVPHYRAFFEQHWPDAATAETAAAFLDALHADIERRKAETLAQDLPDESVDLAPEETGASAAKKTVSFAPPAAPVAFRW